MIAVMHARGKARCTFGLMPHEQGLQMGTSQRTCRSGAKDGGGGRGACKGAFHSAGFSTLAGVPH